MKQHVWLLVWWTVPLAACAAERNVVLFVTDDQGPDAGCYGNPVIKTPHLDALAADGVRLGNAFCTTASCSPSRSVILTGLHNHATGQYGLQHHFHKFRSYTNLASLPVYLHHAGYRTARCGKLHVAPESVYQFDVVLPPPPARVGSRSTVAMAEACESWIATDDERPFFLYFCTSDPHRSGDTADELPHAPNRFGNPAPGGEGYDRVTEVVYDPAEVVVPDFLPDTPTCRAELAQYYQSISRVDQGLGRLVEILKQANRWDNTLLVFISDHGIAMPAAKTTLYDGGMRVPCVVRNPYQQQRGTINDAMVSWVDLAPTILDFAGVLDRPSGRVAPQVLAKLADPDGAQPTRDVKPGTFHGRSFLPVLDDKSPDDDSPTDWDTVFGSHTFHEIQMYYPMRVVRTRRFKLIWNIAHPLPFPFAADLWAAPTWQAQYQQGPQTSYGPRTVADYIHRPEFELYDLQVDPYEATNLAYDDRYATQFDKLKERLRQFQRETNDPWIVKWRYE